MYEELAGKRVGLVFSGAVAQGGFEAGVLETLAKANPRIVSIAGTSSGSLNAAIAAAGVATGRLGAAAQALHEMWVDDASFAHIASVHFSNWFHLQGVFTTDKLRELVETGLQIVVGGWQGPAQSKIALTMVTTNLNGVRRKNTVPLPTYEQPITFRGQDLLDRTAWPRIANAAAASAAFPALFSPTLFDGAPCVDGGAVNNTPISHVLSDDDVDAVVVTTTESDTIPSKASLGGTALVARIASALIDERIAYDLSQAQKDNARFVKVQAALKDAAVPNEKQKLVLDALGYKRIGLYLVQPNAPLPGDAFSGLSNQSERIACIDAGKQAVAVSL
jgi:NTE family protein